MTDLIADFRDTFGERASAIDAEWRKHRAAILADANLSGQGKQAALADADTRRREAVQRVKNEAEMWAKYEISSAHETLAKARAEDAKQRRSILGDALTADITRRRLAMMAPVEMMAAIETAPDDFHATLYRELVDLELRTRANDGDNGAAGALLNLGSLVPEGVRELETALSEFERRGDDLVNNLDATQYRENMGDAFGVNPEYVDV